MIKHGINPIRKDHRDYDHHKTFGTAGFDVTTLPTDLNMDAGISMPNQNLPYPEFNIPALPMGCTGYTQSELGQDEDGQLYNPRFTYDVTLKDEGIAGETQGCNIRDSLASTIQLGFQDAQGAVGNCRVAYFNIIAASPLDWFDAIRVAIFSTQQEKRSVSIGTPWYAEWESPTNGILPSPANIQNIAGLPWHNYKIAGWKTINGVPYLLVKSWQGAEYGDAGWAYMPRSVINSVMAVKGTGAFTLSRLAGVSPQPVDLGIVATLVSFIRNLLNL